MSDREQAAQLLAMAAKDLKAARAMLDRAAFDDEIFGFHVQQACEKCLKAWLAHLGVEYPRTHDLAFLLDQVAIRDRDANAFRDLVDYSAFAVQYRYEILESTPDDELDRTLAVSRVEQLSNTVRAKSSVPDA